MARQRDYKAEDKNRNSKVCGIRVDKELFELFKSKTEKNGTSMNAILIQAIEDYVFNNGDE